MIAEVDDCCLWTSGIVAELWWRLPPAYKPRSGPAPDCSDSELLTMALVGECRGWAQETELVQEWRERRHLVPIVPERSHCNRRRRHLAHAVNAIRQGVLAVLDVAQDRQGAIDSVPLPVVQFHLVPGAPSAATWQSHGAAYGKVPTKKQTIFGYKLQLLVTRNGVIRDFILAPARASAVAVGAELLRAQRDLATIGDTGDSSAPLAAELREACAVTLLTVPRRNQRQQLPPAVAALLNHWRQLIETISGHLTEQLHLGRHHAHTFWGLCARLYTKLAAHTRCVYLNRLTGAPDCLQIKALACPHN